MRVTRACLQLGPSRPGAARRAPTRLCSGKPLPSMPFIAGLSDEAFASAGCAVRPGTGAASKTAAARSSVTARENGLFSSARTTGSCAVDRRRHSRVIGQLEGDLRFQRILDLSRLTPPAAPMRLATSETRSRGEAEPVDRLQTDADVLQRRDLGVADEQQRSVWSSAASIARVEERPRVDDDRARTRLPRGVENRGELGLADHVAPLRDARRRQHSECQRGAGPCRRTPSACRCRCRRSRRRGRRSSRAGSLASVSAESPNCRSRSTRSVDRPERAVATARFVASTVLPLPPLGEKTVTTLPVARAAVAIAAFRSANSSVSVGCGSTSTSAAPTVRPVSTIPFGSP